ncbi:hypothetical protein WR25_16111 isoform E [Diploscapter pachys]|uniref:C2 domain-containing protein n=1 Tax=Diploscapter pachys TaxID=2018661 RepID=A0A2A2LBC9_9BILA|nr:hypothetical protein WR25_16111 isoform A [Diploscapter pachys]PAV83367.1 hypothetical protein WR25_16111 isoform E [Diploscapter pachys]
MLNFIHSCLQTSDALDMEDINYVALLVKIRLKSGTDLAIKDASGSSDPYVKFKHGDRIVYRSNTVFKSLNPIWEEEFQMLVEDISIPLIAQVYDWDRFCSDDFMGEAQIDLSKFRWFDTVECDLSLIDPNETADLGQITVNIVISPLTVEEKDVFLQKSYRGVLSEAQRKREKLVQVWKAVVNILLIEGRNIQFDFCNTTNPLDPYCKFKIGQEKYKSKICNRTSEPNWVEQFDMHIYDETIEELEIMCVDRKSNKTIGKTKIDLSRFERDETVQRWYDLDPIGSILLLITISGRQSTHTVVDLSEFTQNDVRNAIIAKYDIPRTLSDMKDVGFLSVKVFRADNLPSKDLGGKSDPFVVIELVNTRLQTHTEYKTLAPQWNKLFTFMVKDIHTCLDVTVYDEDPNNKFEFIGRVSIPLLAIRNGERRWYALKDRKLTQRVKGEILLEIDLIYNPIRAALRTFNPKEKKYFVKNPKFKAALFRATVMQLKEFVMEIISWKDYAQSCFNWHSTTRSITAFVVYIFAVCYMELYHVPLGLLFLLFRGYVYRRISDNLRIPPDSPRIDLKIHKSDANNKNVKKEAQNQSSLLETISSVQDTLTVVQTSLVFITALLDRIKNTFNFTNKWLSSLAVLVLTIATVLLYFVPFRWVLIAWGINKFTKKLRNPNYISNNELLDFLSRVPTDQELDEWQDYLVQKRVFDNPTDQATSSKRDNISVINK